VKVTYILDTNTLSYIASGKSQTARAEFRRLVNDDESQLCISVITEAEIRAGMNKRALSPARREAIERLFSAVEILPWGSEEAAMYAKVKPILQAGGIGVSLMDLLIGVHAASTGAVLVTHDGIFARMAQSIDLFATVDWAKDV
jgi:tRNA(fMet)-specific endonuclease VapC